MPHEQDMPGGIKIRCMQTYMKTARGRKGGQVRGYEGKGIMRTSKKGKDRKSGFGWRHSRSARNLQTWSTRRQPAQRQG